MNQPEKRVLALLAVQHARAHTRSEMVKTKHVSSAAQISLWSPPVKFSLDPVNKHGDRRGIACQSPQMRENWELVAQGRKRCHTCKEIKPVQDFHHSKDGVGGVSRQCKDCACKDSRQRFRLRIYGMSYEEYMALFDAQEGAVTRA
jgi:hypothetical protein